MRTSKELINIKKSIENYISNILQKNNNLFKKNIIVLSGGGIKGIVHIGILQKLYNYGCLENINTFAGASIGALIIALIIVGYTPMEIWEFIQLFDFTKIIKIDITKIGTNYGVDEGSKFEYVLKCLIEAKYIDPYITLLNLYKKTKKYIIFSAASINTQSVHYISYKTFPDMPLLTAIRITTCIPLYFTPIKYIHNNAELILIDGGCIDNYPIHLFEDNLDNVIGVYLNNDTENIEKIDNITNYIKLLFETLSNGMSFNAIRSYTKSTINIIVKGVGMAEFNLDIKKKRYLYDLGFNAL